MKNVHLSVRPERATPRRVRLWIAAIALSSSACAGPRAVPTADWLPASDGWAVRDVDEGEPPRWVLYDRDSPEADVKEIRVVGLVDAEPEAVAEALRRRLLDEANVPEGTTRRIIRASETEVDVYGRSSLPFPFDDREVTERIRFSEDPRAGAFLAHIESIDPGEADKPGVLRIPLVRSRFVVSPAGPSRSAVTMDSVHDLGGHFPNWAIYGPVGDYLVDELTALGELTAAAAP